MGGASIVNNQVSLSAAGGQYVNLPSGLLAGRAAASIETWATTAFLNTGWVLAVFSCGGDECS